MGNHKHNSRGFTLIAALLITVLLTGVAAGLLFMVSNEVQMSGNDLEDNIAFYGAESGMEKLTSDLGALYQASASPLCSQVQNLTNYPPTSAMVGVMTYTETIYYSTPCTGTPVSTTNTISSGSNQGLYAEIIPMTLQVNATRPLGASVNITRQVQVALIPVFQFGVFCAYDCSYFAGPDFSFGGRVHANGNLFLASGDELVFNDKIAAYNEIIMDELENGHPTSSGYGGTVYASNATNGCPLNSFPPSGTNCVALPTSVPGDASWSGGIPPNGTANASFPSISSGGPPLLNGYFANSLTGATKLELPFVSNSCDSNPPPCTDPIEIIRKPLAGSSSTSTLSQSQMYSKAQIRILLADTQADLHPERVFTDADDVQMNPATYAPGPSGTTSYYFATAKPSVSGNWIAPYSNGALTTWTQWPLLGEITTNPSGSSNPTTNGAWIRVEYLNNSTGNWTGVTREWLSFGFARQYNTQLTVPATSNTFAGNAILLLQQLRNTTVTGTNDTDYYPINLYDTREGEMRDNEQATSSCAVMGIMNVVELDAGNLARWLKGTFGSSGTLVNYTNQNGYVLYFSDHRGMLVDPNISDGGGTPAGVISGEAGLEDVINTSAGAGGTDITLSPDGVLEPKVYYTYSPEDVDQNGVLDNWGGKNIGYGFGQNTSTSSPTNPYVRNNSCPTQGAANMVTGARHALRLVDGGMNSTGTSYLPVRPDNSSGGFTVASENPVYVWGNYNSSQNDPFWTNNANNTTPHSAASIIGDAVTVLSNQWSDTNSLTNTTCTMVSGNCTISRAPTADAYYRMAISGGKNIPFPQPSWGAQDYGTDGGMHNFLRYLENWGGYNLWYNGSLVSMYYSEYATGVFKCCNTVYSPPTRKYYFDTLFLSPANLPPGTPTFQDVENLNYHENFSAQ